MARKTKIEKAQEKEVLNNFPDLYKVVSSEIQKIVGGEVTTNAKSILENKREVISWSPSMDLILHGGIPKGTWLSMAGPAKSGKTTSLLTLAASAQAAGMTVIYGNVEHRLKDMNLTGISGLNFDEDKFIVIESKKGKILSSKDHLNAYKYILQNIPNCLLIIDSVSALVSQKELDDGIGVEQRGKDKTLISQFCNICSSYVPINNSIVAGVNHYYANTSGYGAAKAEKTATRWIYQADTRIRVKEYKKWTIGSDDDSSQIGLVTAFECFEACSLGPPGRVSETYIRFGKGIDKEYELLKYGISLGLIKQGGAWYDLLFIEGNEDLEKNESIPKKIQGLEKVYNVFNENEILTEILEEKIKEYLCE